MKYRKPGFYWIKYRESDEWKPAQLNPPGNYLCKWDILDSDFGYEEHEFYKVGPEIIFPKDY